VFYYLLCVQYHLGTSGLKGGGKERRSSRKTTPSKKLLLSKESSDTFAQHDAEAEVEMKSKRAQTRAQKQTVVKRVFKGKEAMARSDAVFSHEELEALAGAESPRPASLSSEAIDQLVRDAQELLHAPHEVCAVCDEIVLHKRDILLQSSRSFPMLSSRDSCHQMELRLDVRSWIRFCCHNTTFQHSFPFNKRPCLITCSFLRGLSNTKV